MAVASEVHFCCFYFCFLSSSLANHAFHTKEILWSIQHQLTKDDAAHSWSHCIILDFRLGVVESTARGGPQQWQTRQSTSRPFWAFSPYFFFIFFSSMTMCSSETVAVFCGCTVYNGMDYYGRTRVLLLRLRRPQHRDWEQKIELLPEVSSGTCFFLHNKGHHIFESFFFFFSWGISQSCLYVTLFASLKIQAIFLS